MPELPEVETVARGLRRSGLVGLTVLSARVGWPRTIEGMSASDFCGRLSGCRILGVGRRGKYLLFRLSSGFSLLIHLRMTGRLALVPRSAGANPHEHVILCLDDGRDLRFHDTRKFGRWNLTALPEKTLSRLGPEPLSPRFTRSFFVKRIRNHKALVKPLLLNQRFLAGLGNIYVDEALWQAGIHPRRIASVLTSGESSALYDAIRLVLKLGIKGGGTSLGSASTNFHGVGGARGSNQSRLSVFRRTGQPCPRCGAVICRLTVGQRSTHVCPRCQPLRPRAVRRSGTIGKTQQETDAPH